MMRNCLLLFILVIALHSCTINSNSYESLSQAMKDRVCVPTVPLDSLKKDGMVYKVSDVTLREFLRSHESTVVHVYMIWCKSENCVHPQVAIDRIKTAGYTPFVISGDYECVKVMDEISTPLYVIDFDYYNTKRYDTGIKKMFMSLGCTEDNWWYDWFLFKKDKLVGCYRTMEELQKAQQPWRQ